MFQVNCSSTPRIKCIANYKGKKFDEKSFKFKDGEIRTNENTSCAELPGTWTDFSDFSACSVSCGEGVRVKTRQCVGGRCEGESQITKNCKRKCPLGERTEQSD